jgi:hypothetical protein
MVQSVYKCLFRNYDLLYHLLQKQKINEGLHLEVETFTRHEQRTVLSDKSLNRADFN